jgi:hypothetical protein
MSRVVALWPTGSSQQVFSAIALGDCYLHRTGAHGKEVTSSLDASPILLVEYDCGRLGSSDMDGSC